MERSGWRAALLAAGLLLGCADGDADDDDADHGLECPAPGPEAGRLPEAKLYFEHNATDGDTGLHGLLDQDGWSRLCVYDPGGEQLLVVRPRGSLGQLGMASLYFESREPRHGEVAVADHFAVFPAGTYTIRGTTYDGEDLTGEATLSHDLPAPTTIIAPAHDSVLPPHGLVVTWEPVTRTIDDRPVQVTGYEVIVTNEEIEDPHGNAQPIYHVHVPPSVTSLPVPDVFLEAGTVYEVEVLTLEVSGNQTISTIFFQTE